MTLLDLEDLDHIALGASVLGTGGGGDPTLGKLMAQQAVRRHGPIRLVSLDEAADEAWLIPTAMMGAPTVLVEKIPSGTEVLDAFRMVEHHLQSRAFATLSIEAGGVNSMIPMLVAARLGIPVIDADGMGRAFPEIQMVTPSLHGVSATPMAIGDEKGNRVLLETVDNFWTERLARTATVSLGCSTAVALYPMRARVAKKALLRGTLSLARRIGQTLHAPTEHEPIEALLELLGGRRLGQGKVTDVRRQTRQGFARGELDIRGTGPDAGVMFRLAFQNENLLFWREGQPQATVPDLITVVDEQSGRPVTTEGLQYGLRVAVLGFPSHRQWQTPAGLALVGPRAFGYEIDYVPLHASTA